MAAYDIISKVGLCQLMCIYRKNNHAKLHPYPIWNDGTLGFLKRSSQQEEEQQDE